MGNGQAAALEVSCPTFSKHISGCHAASLRHTPKQGCCTRMASIHKCRLTPPRNAGFVNSALKEIKRRGGGALFLTAHVSCSQPPTLAGVHPGRNEQEQEKARACGATSELSEPGDVRPAVNRAFRPIFLCMNPGVRGLLSFSLCAFVRYAFAFLLLLSGCRQGGRKSVGGGGAGALTLYCIGMWHVWDGV